MLMSDLPVRAGAKVVPCFSPLSAIPLNYHSTVIGPYLDYYGPANNPPHVFDSDSAHATGNLNLVPPGGELTRNMVEK